MKSPNYDFSPFISVLAPYADKCWPGWAQMTSHLNSQIPSSSLIVVECYPGVNDDEIRKQFTEAFSPSLVIDTKTLFKSPEEIDQLIAPDLGGDDPVFGYLTRLEMEDFFDANKLQAAKERITETKNARILIVGPGASLMGNADLFIYADMPRWEGQLRQRRGEVDNLGSRNRGTKPSLQYKRAFFIDWRVADRLKKRTMDRWDYLLDTTTPDAPKLITGEALRETLKHIITRPFRVVPFFDPGPWGGQWMRRKIGLPEGPPNYAWGFDCVPEENSLLLQFGKMRVEIPSINLIFAQPSPLLGEAVYGRFGSQFPIRFDFLDTVEGGNLSFQVHPLVDYAREKFGLCLTQDESYYLLDAEPEAVVYLGLKKGIDPEEMIANLREAQSGKVPFDDEKYAARFPAEKHDHFLIPAGTVHCSGTGSMVLEISATPYIFTFKLWDWARLGLDGNPRPIHLDHGKAAIQWDWDEEYVQKHLINHFEKIASGEGWSEERTGLHASQFIETRRHWFSVPVTHRRTGSVEILNLVEGEAAIIESPTNRFAPMEVHYAETFILPDAAGDYVIRPKMAGEKCATIKAFVRTKNSEPTV